MTFRSAHTTLFIYLHSIVLQAPGNVIVSVSKVRCVVHGRIRGETGYSSRAREGTVAVAFAIVGSCT